MSEETHDVKLATYLLMGICNQTCFECGASDTPLWRKGEYSDRLGNYIYRCNACGIRLARHAKRLKS